MNSTKPIMPAGIPICIVTPTNAPSTVGIIDSASSQ